MSDALNKKKNDIGEMLVLIMQIGISMIVPIALMVALSVFIVNKTGIKWISVILFIIGALAGFRNVYNLVKKHLQKEKQPYEIAKEEAAKEAQDKEAQVKEDSEPASEFSEEESDEYN